jgi:hypothetical protein
VARGILEDDDAFGPELGVECKERAPLRIGDGNRQPCMLEDEGVRSMQEPNFPTRL